MQLSKALQVKLEFNGFINSIHIDENGDFNANDMFSFFPHKRLDNWLRSENVSEFIKVLERSLNPNLEDYLNTSQMRELNFRPAIRTKRGRYGGGTYLHKHLAMKLAMWLSPEFELEVIKAYECGIVRKEAWDIQRVMAANGYKFLVESVTENIVPEFEKNKKSPQFAYTEEADLLNLVIFGKRAVDAGGNQRDTASKLELELIEYLQRLDSGLIEAGLNYDQRFEKLTELCDRKRLQLLQPSSDKRMLNA